MPPSPPGSLQGCDASDAPWLGTYLAAPYPLTAAVAGQLLHLGRRRWRTLLPSSPRSGRDGTHTVGAARGDARRRRPRSWTSPATLRSVPPADVAAVPVCSPAHEPAGGGSGIRTHGGSPHAGFQDRSIRPLWHPPVPLCGNRAATRRPPSPCRKRPHGTGALVERPPGSGTRTARFAHARTLSRAAAAQDVDLRGEAPARGRGLGRLLPLGALRGSSERVSNDPIDEVSRCHRLRPAAHVPSGPSRARRASAPATTSTSARTR